MNFSSVRSHILCPLTKMPFLFWLGFIREETQAREHSMERKVPGKSVILAGVGLRKL